eukprot:MONOS_15655.1-p1 / transcript=MONOS_15655.1 / gene=MONOS_15655 / organism=Monocercomonoides_exilis_PA203 / gene_product=unspecified product / transcript_product=unspecified product / location=Mono_scaffold01300:159-1879(+) / protein_length=544 / sequence_SO=supercontig / SO=protein_coding / is_pseudo=false
MRMHSQKHYAQHNNQIFINLEMIRLLQQGDGRGRAQKGASSLNEYLGVLIGFNGKYEGCARNERLVIVVGKSGAGKSTLINAVLGAKMEENGEGKVVKVGGAGRGPRIGDGIVSETQFAECFELDGATVLDTKGFVGSNIDAEGDIVSVLVMEANRRKAKNVMVVYVSEYENLCNVSKMREDAEFISKICEDGELPVVFVANKCKLRWAMKEKSSGQLGDVLIEKVQARLHEDLGKLYREQMREIRGKFFGEEKGEGEGSGEGVSEKEMMAVLEKSRVEEEGLVRKADIEKCLRQVKTLCVLKRAAEGGRLLYYDPVDFYSVERIKSMVHDANYFVGAERVWLGGSTAESEEFVGGVSGIAGALRLLVGAMRGRRGVPRCLKEVVGVCGDFECKCCGGYGVVSESMRDVEATLKKIRIGREGRGREGGRDGKEEREGKEEGEGEMDAYERLKEQYEAEIGRLDSEEVVKYETMSFRKHSNRLQNQKRFEKRIEVANTTFKFIAGNSYTYSDEKEQRSGIEGGVFRAVYKAPNPTMVAGSVVARG